MSAVLYFDCFSGAAGDMVLGAFLDAGLPQDELRRALGSLGVGHDLRVSRVLRAGLSATRVEVLDTGAAQPAAAHAAPAFARAAWSQPRSSARTLARARTFPQSRSRPPNPSGNRAPDRSLRPVGEWQGAGRGAVRPAGRGRGRHPQHACFRSASARSRRRRLHHRHRWAPCSRSSGSGSTTSSRRRSMSAAAPSRSRTAVSSAGAGDDEAAERRPGVQLGSPGGTGDADWRPGRLELREIVRPVARDDRARDRLRRRDEGLRAFAQRRCASSSASALERTLSEADAGETVIKIECEIDDMSPQLFGPVSERLLTHGALDVFLTPVQMKKGRPGTLLTVLAPPGATRDPLRPALPRDDDDRRAIRVDVDGRRSSGGGWTSRSTGGSVRIKVAGTSRRSAQCRAGVRRLRARRGRDRPAGQGRAGRGACRRG